MIDQENHLINKKGVTIMCIKRVSSLKYFILIISKLKDVKHNNYPIGPDHI